MTDRYTWEQVNNPERYNIRDTKKNAVIMTLETWDDAEIVTQFLNVHDSSNTHHIPSVCFFCNNTLEDGTICATMESEDDGITCKTCGTVND